MQKHYRFTEIGIEYEKHPVIEQIHAVEDAFAAIGHPVNLEAFLKAKPGTKAGEKGLYITPQIPEKLDTQLDEIGWLSTHENIDETFADEVESSTELTNIVVRNDLSVQEVVKRLSETEYDDSDDTDMVEKVKHVVDLFWPGCPNPWEVVAYDVLRKSLGWEAERVLQETDDFHKLLASLDEKGADLGTNKDSPWDDKGTEGFQLKTMQRVTSQNLHKKEHEYPHLSYAWVSDGIVVCDMDHRSVVLEGNTRGTDLHAEYVADEADVSTTVVKKSHHTGTMSDYGRPGRVMAW